MTIRQVFQPRLTAKIAMRGLGVRASGNDAIDCRVFAVFLACPSGTFGVRVPIAKVGMEPARRQINAADFVIIGALHRGKNEYRVCLALGPGPRTSVITTVCSGPASSPSNAPPVSFGRRRRASFHHAGHAGFGNPDRYCA